MGKVENKEDLKVVFSVYKDILKYEYASAPSKAKKVIVNLSFDYLYFLTKFF